MMKRLWAALALAMVASLLPGPIVGAENNWNYFAVVTDEDPASEANEASTLESPAGETVVGDRWDTPAVFDECCATDWCRCRSCPSPWAVEGGALFLQRSKPGRSALVTDSFAPGDNTVLNGAGFGFDFQAGWEVGIQHRVNECFSLETRYMRVDGWEATLGPRTSGAGAIIQYASPLGNNSWPVGVDARYHCQLDGVEFNGRQAVNDWLTLLAGFRYIDMKERLDIDLNIGPNLNLASNGIRASNYLYGFQVGADMLWWSGRRLEIDSVLKAGVYGNRALSSARQTQRVSTNVDYCHASGDHTSFVGELTLGGIYKFTDGCRLRAGYQLLWLEGVAVASDQVAVSDPLNGVAVVDATGSPFYQGAYVGLECAW